MKAWQLILLLAVLFVTLYYAQTYFRTDMTKLVQQPQSDQLRSSAKTFFDENQDTLLRYQNQEWGFSLYYPLGYELDDSGDNASLVLRSAVPNALPQVFSVSIERQNLDENSLVSSGAERSTTFSGKNFFYSTTENFDGFWSAAIYKCTALNGSPYVAVFTAFVPASFPEDVETANFMAHSFDC